MMRRIKLNRDRTLDILHPKKYYVLAAFGCFKELQLMTRVKTEYGIKYGLVSIHEENPKSTTLGEDSLQMHAKRLMNIITDFRTNIGIIEVDSLDEIVHKSREEIKQFITDTGGNIID